MSDIDDKPRVKRREHILNLEDKRRLADIGFVMASVEGRRVMNDLLKRCGVGRLSFSGPGQAEQTAFYEGQRNIGNYYWGMLTKNFKEEWLIMTDEYEKHEEAKNVRPTNGNDNGRTGRDDDPNDQGNGNS